MICTIIDGLTKYAKFVPCKTIMTAKELAKLFLKKKIADHGIPEQIISDKNKLFTSKFNTGLRKILKMKKSMSTAFHFQTNGQTKRMNQTLKQYLKLFAKENKHKWVELLPMAQMAINNSYNENLKQIPHEVLYGTILKTVEIGPTSNQTASTFATKMKNNWAAIGTRIIKTKQKVKKTWTQKKTLLRSNQRTKHCYQQKTWPMTNWIHHTLEHLKCWMWKIPQLNYLYPTHEFSRNSMHPW